MLSKYVLRNLVKLSQSPWECTNASFHNIRAMVMVIKTIVFTIILKFNGPDGIFSKMIKNKKKLGLKR
jgi:hypothetical protein